ncbi:YggT family protein [Labrys miyagiensis]|uniref:YggT family protein n=1 Tax=Labrys miyagiensis TaxID=346912 RepID=A0ABQ6CNW0_9HYPH|nr:YggT family protein [Labrys miyagiensis]GLS21834.1 YggT family protein [Labrys miyagiensis]
MQPIFIIIVYLLQIYAFILLASIVFSWLVAFNIVSRRNPMVASVGDVLYRLTEPVLAPIRRRLPDFGNLDLSPIVVFLVIWLLQMEIVQYVIPNVP